MRTVQFSAVLSFALAPALTVSAALAAELWISEETLLDPGYRTASGDSESYLESCEVACGPNGGLAVWTGGPSGSASTRAWDDTTVIGREAHYISAALSNVDDRELDLGGQDGVGYKVLSLLPRGAGQRG